MSTPILGVKKIVKSYGGVVVVDDVSFSVEQGQCLGLLGPNGAGKSTIIEIIETITQQDSGQIYYKGALVDKRFKRESGIQFQNTALMDFLTVRDQLQLFGELFPHSLDINEIVAYCQLENFVNRDVKKLSGGQRQRVLLALALINDPEIVFLDEPTTGLDPQSRSRFWTLIKKLKEDGKSIILTTHYMDEAESLSDQLILMDCGKVIAEGSPTQLLASHFEHSLVSISLDQWQLGDTFQQPVEKVKDKIVIQSRSVESTIAALIVSEQSLDSLQVRKPTLEDLFLKLTGNELRE